MHPDVLQTESMEFIKKKEPAHKLISKSAGATTLCGKVFGNIIILLAS